MAPELDPPFHDLAHDRRWEEYGRRLADDGLAWWFDMEVPRIAAHVAALPAEHAGRRSPRLLLLEGTFTTLPEGRRPKQVLRDIGILYRLLQARRDREGIAAACCLACAAVWDFGDDLAAAHPWRRRMALLVRRGDVSPLAHAALLAFDAHYTLFHEGDPAAALATLDHQRMAAEAARSAAQGLYGATLQAIAHTWAGEAERAALTLEDAEPLLDRAHPSSHTGLYFEIARAIAACAMGEGAAAYRRLTAVAAAVPGAWLRPSIALLFDANRLLAAALAGMLEESERLSARLRARAGSDHIHLYTALLHFAAGVARLGVPRPYRALIHAEAGEAAAKRAACLPFAVMNRLLAGIALADLNEGAEATTRLCATITECEAKGLLLFTEAATVELAALALGRGESERARSLIDGIEAAMGPGRSCRSAVRPAPFTADLLARLRPRPTRHRYWAVGEGHERPIIIRALGHFQLTVHGEAVYDRRWGRGRTQRLLKLILALGGDKVAIADLIELLWPDVDGGRGYASLKTALARLRRTGQRGSGSPIQWIHWQESRLSLSTATVAADTLAFEEGVRQLRAAPAPPLTPGDLTFLLDLYQGDFLPGEEGYGMIERRRNLLRQAHLWAVERLIDAGGAGTAGAPLELLAEAVRVNPLTERLHVLKMATQIECGYTVDALATFAEAKALFRDHLGLAPGPELRRLATRARRGR